MAAFRGQFVYRTPAQRAADDDRRGTPGRKAESPRLTKAEKAERRAEHAERLATCRDWLGTDDGMREFLISRELNPDVSPLNAALAAFQAPRAIVGTASAWKRNGARIRRGETACAFYTAPGFWPKPAFAASQTDAPPELADVYPRIPAPDFVAHLLEIYRGADDVKAGFTRVLAALEAGGEIPTIEADPPASTPGGSDEIPF